MSSIQLNAKPLNVLRATISDLARVIGCSREQAPEVVHSERSARRSFEISRRGFFIGAGAVAAAAAFSFPKPRRLIRGVDGDYIFVISRGGHSKIMSGRIDTEAPAPWWQIDDYYLEPSPERYAEETCGVTLSGSQFEWSFQYIFLQGRWQLRTVASGSVCPITPLFT